MSYMKSIKPTSKSPNAGAFLRLVGETVNGIDETREVCSHYLAVKNGASLTDAHPYATGQINYEGRTGEARISDIAEALVCARYGAKRVERDATLGTPSQFIAAAISTGDLPAVLSDAAKLMVMPSYDSLTEDIHAWTKPVFVSDFKESVFASIDVNDLVEIKEGAEAKHGTIYGNGERMKLKTFGRNLLVSRPLLINNDADVIFNGVKAYAVSASRKDAMLQYGALNDNPVMEDGTPLFHADHNNLVSPAKSLFTASLDEAMAMLRNQPTVSGEKSNAKTAYILVPPSLEGTALNAANHLLSGNNGKIEVITSAYLNGLDWYVFASPEQYPVVGRVMMEDSKVPFFISQGGHRSVPLKYDGLGISVRLDVNAVIISHVGAVKIPGV